MTAWPRSAGRARRADLPLPHRKIMNSPSPRHTPARAGAVVHRPPVATAMPVTAPLTFSPNAALLIDFDNVTMGIRSDLQTELKNLLSSDIIKGKVQLRRAYADWRRYPQYVAPLAESSIDMIMAPAYGSSKKNATDIRLAIDALELVFTRPEIGTYILLSGDSDFSTLVIKLKEYGKYVIGVGIRESSSDLLVMNCDEYFSYNALAGLVRSDNEPTDGGVRRDPWELVSAALQRMQRNEDVMRADRLKQVMQDIDSSFDEKNLGMSKFSRFVQEAAHRGLLSLSKLENGQLEVAPPRAKSGTSEEGAAVAAEPSRPRDGSTRRRKHAPRNGVKSGAGAVVAEAAVAGARVEARDRQVPSPPRPPRSPGSRRANCLLHQHRLPTSILPPHWRTSSPRMAGPDTGKRAREERRRQNTRNPRGRPTFRVGCSGLLSCRAGCSTARPSDYPGSDSRATRHSISCVVRWPP